MNCYSFKSSFRHASLSCIKGFKVETGILNVRDKSRSVQVTKGYSFSN